jgi:hypothetical protein
MVDLVSINSMIDLPEALVRLNQAFTPPSCLYLRPKIWFNNATYDIIGMVVLKSNHLPRDFSLPF